MILAPFQYSTITAETRPMPSARVRDYHRAADPYRELAAAVVVRALRDLAAGDQRTADKAREWLLSDGLEWLRMLGYDPEPAAVRIIALAFDGDCRRAEIANQQGSATGADLIEPETKGDF